jgi:hypothetical protein
MEFDFNKAHQVESLETVPEQFRGAYVENSEGEGYVINPTVKPMAEAIVGLNSALAKARKEAKGNRGPSAEELLEPTGFKSIDELSEHMTALKEQLEKAGEGKINLDKMKADMQKAFDRQLAEKDQAISGMSSSLERYLVEKEAISAISKAKGIPDLLFPHIRSQTKVVRDGDDYVVRVVDADGEFRGDGKGGFMGIGDLVSELKSSPTFGRAFESEAPRGGGAPPRQQPPGNFQQRQQNVELSPTQKIARGLQKRG